MLKYGVYENSQLIRSDEIVPHGLRGEIAYITIKKTLTDKLGKPFNSCEDSTSESNNSLINEISLMGSEYSQTLCFRLCLLRYLENACTCSLQKQLGQNGSDTCSHDCVEAIKDSFDFQKKCRLCPLECDSVSYDLVSQTRNIAENRIELSRMKTEYSERKEKFSNYSFEYVQEKIIKFQINFDKLGYLHVSELPKTTFTNLIAELGGTIGMSVAYFKLITCLNCF